MRFTSSQDLKESLIRYPCFAHPTVMIRRDVLIMNGIVYDDEYLYAEDYKLWIDLMSYGDFYNIHEKLLNYRISDFQITQPSNLIQVNNAKKCRCFYMSKVLSDKFIDEYNKYGVTLSLIKKVRLIRCSKDLLSVLYLSLNDYNCNVILFYLFSLDVFKLGKRTFLQFMKRLLRGSIPYL